MVKARSKAAVRLGDARVHEQHVESAELAPDGLGNRLLRRRMGRSSGAPAVATVEPC